MSAFKKHKLSDAVPQPEAAPGFDESGKPRPTHDTVAEQARAADESAAARNNEASIRDRMVDIGRGTDQAGRHESE